MRGYFAIGIYQPKHEVNIGTLWRSAHSLGASHIFTIGNRLKKQASDTTTAWKHLPLLRYESSEEFLKVGVPYDCQLIGIEISQKARSLSNFVHPERAIYILGAEDRGLPETILNKCKHILQLPGLYCLNVAVVGSSVIIDRLNKEEIKERTNICQKLRKT
jgi:tRNA G18 (ribose-2'-O)-methylase SpoU